MVHRVPGLPKLRRGVRDLWDCERFSTLRAEPGLDGLDHAAEFREAFDLFADAESGQLHGAEKLGLLLRSMGMCPTDSELDSTAREFSLAGDGRRLSWEGFEALMLTHHRLETVGGETIAAEYTVLGLLRDYRRVVSERGVAGLTEAEFGAWLENWEGLLGGVMGDGAEGDSDRALTVDDIAALECLEGLVSPEDVADMKAELPPDAARQAGGVEAPGAGGSGGEPLAFREAVRRVFQRFGHAECVQGGRVVWIGGRE